MDPLAPKCDICKQVHPTVDVVECPECGACPLLCEGCALTKPCPECGALPPADELTASV